MVKLNGPMLAPRNGQPPRQLFVLLHGYGADGNDLIDLGRHWGGLFPEALFVAPNAPTICAQNAMGYEWFPIGVDRHPSWMQGIGHAAPVLGEFLEDLWAQTGLGPRETVLAGFSQGAMLALHVGTALGEPLRAILAFSGAFIASEAFAAGIGAKPPVALMHGEEDSVLDAEFSRTAAAELEAAGFDVGLHLTPGLGHGISNEGLAFATSFVIAQMD